MSKILKLKKGFDIKLVGKAKLELVNFAPAQTFAIKPTDFVGLQRPKGGEILWDGRRIDGLPSHRIVERGLALILESGRPFPEMTVRENLEMGAYVRRTRGGLGETLEQVFDLFPVLRDRQSQLAGTLSGGERQMLAISRAVVSGEPARRCEPSTPIASSRS